MTISPAALDTIERLVGFDSTSRKSNLEIIDYLKDRLEGLGAERHSLVELHVVPEGGGLPDHDTRAVVDEEMGPKPRARVDVRAGSDLAIHPDAPRSHQPKSRGTDSFAAAILARDAEIEVAVVRICVKRISEDIAAAG